MNPMRALTRWGNLDENHLLTRKEAAHALDTSVSVLCQHAYAGLLPFIPGRPVHMRVGDLRLYAKMLSNGTSKSLHRSLRIEHRDRQAYSPLHGVTGFINHNPELMVKTVVRETGFLWQKFKEAQKHKAKKGKRKERAAALLTKITSRRGGE